MYTGSYGSASACVGTPYKILGQNRQITSKYQQISFLFYILFILEMSSHITVVIESI